jgi:hypothetical protein
MWLSKRYLMKIHEIMYKAVNLTYTIWNFKNVFKIPKNTIKKRNNVKLLFEKLKS